MQKLSVQVHGLIHSLSATEKAHFKKTNGGRGATKLLKAFDILNGMAEYDRTAVDAQFKANGISKEVIYSQLFASLRRSLGLYHSERSTVLTLNETIHSLEILYPKKQYGLCQRLIDKGIALADGQQLHEYSIMLRAWRLKLHRAQLEIVDSSVEENHLQMMQEVHHLKVMYEYQHLRHQLMGLSNTERISAKVRKQVTEDILDHPVFKDTTPDCSTNFQVKWAMVVGGNYMIGRWEEALNAAMQLYNGMADFPDLKSKLEIGNRFNTLFNITRLHQLLYNGKEAKVWLQRINEAMGYKTGLADRPQANIDFVTKDLTINDQILSGQLNGALERCVTLLETNKTQPEVRLRPIAWNVAFIHFLKTDHSKALSYLNSAFFTSDISHMNDMGRWLELLCLYMMHDRSLFESRWRSWHRQLMKEGSDYHWEQVFLETLKKCFGKEVSERAEVLQQCFNELQGHRDEIRTTTVGSFDVLLWLESQLSGTAMIFLMKERYLG